MFVQVSERRALVAPKNLLVLILDVRLVRILLHRFVQNALPVAVRISQIHIRHHLDGVARNSSHISALFFYLDGTLILDLLKLLLHLQVVLFFVEKVKGPKLNCNFLGALSSIQMVLMGLA
jgi:hypothetical protein